MSLGKANDNNTMTLNDDSEIGFEIWMIMGGLDILLFVTLLVFSLKEGYSQLW